MAARLSRRCFQRMSLADITHRDTAERPFNVAQVRFVEHRRLR